MSRALTTDREALIRRYADAGARDDFDAMETLRHPDWQEAWPQSGEVVTSSATYRAARAGRPEGAPRLEPRRIGGTGDCWWSEAVVHYGDGTRWLAVTIYELRDDLVWRERLYFGQPVTAPAWRSHLVEHEAPAIS
jgi:SnoaL-like domain